MPNPMPIHTFAVIAFDHLSPFHLSVPCLVFGETRAEKFPGVPEFDVRVCAVSPGELASTAGFAVTIPFGLEALASAHTVIVPSWPDPRQTAPQALCDALRMAHARGATIVGLCLGAYVLAQAGLLDGRRATTHWVHAADFAQRFPAVNVDANVLYVDDGEILTSAGTAAGLDCCLYLLRRMYGATYANHVARRLVVSPHRPGGQAQFIEQPLPVTANHSRLSELIAWVRANLHLPHSLDSLAARSLMSRRTFTRHFRQIVGSSVTAWLLAERLAEAQRLLESTDQSIEQIAEHVGFGSTVSFRLQFRQAFGVSPRDWRATFGSQGR